MSAQEEYRSKFYEYYHKEAEEYDKEFVKKYDEDLNTTLIFVSFVHRCSGVCANLVTGWSLLCCHLRLYHRGQL